MTEDDHTLLQNYATRRSEEDFAELVRRHLNFIYATALRQVNGDAHLAQDVTQLVFTDLARKAGALAHHRTLAGWLHTSTRYAAAKLVRTEARRRNREQEAQIMQALHPIEAATQSDWEQVRPVLDEALGELDERDREVIILRLLEGRDYAEVGARTAMTDNAARMRTDRALEKLKALLARRGITSSSAALAAALTTHAVTAAPAGMAATITSTALSGATALGGGAVIAALMSMTKLQIGLAAGIIAAGVGGYAWQEREGVTLRKELADLHQTVPIPAAPGPARPGASAHPATTDATVRKDAELARLEIEADRMQAELQAKGGAVPRRIAGPVLSIDQVERKPKASFQAQPEYPDAMRQSGIEGQVIVEFAVNEDGGVEDVRVISSSRKEFEAASIDAVKKWRFTPGEKDGRKVSTGQVQTLVAFRIGGKAVAPPAWF
jgi:RNA polymerase sigma factor (sigma-70 family)